MLTSTWRVLLVLGRYAKVRPAAAALFDTYNSDGDSEVEVRTWSNLQPRAPGGCTLRAARVQTVMHASTGARSVVADPRHCQRDERTVAHHVGAMEVAHPGAIVII